jgi:hypothetical protein
MTGESQPTYGRGGGVEVPSMAGGWRCGGDGGQRRRLKDYHFTVATHGHFASRTKKMEICCVAVWRLSVFAAQK